MSFYFQKETQLFNPHGYHTNTALYLSLVSGTLLKDVSGSRSSSPTMSVVCGEKNGEIAEDLNCDPEENLSHFIAILVESLFLLKKLPEAVEVYSTLPYLSLFVSHFFSLSRPILSLYYPALLPYNQSLLSVILQAVKMRIQPELMAIVSRASEKIVEK